MNDPGRGTGAAPPLWKRVARNFVDHDVPGEAAKLAYFAFLSLPPGLMALFAITGYFGGPEVAATLTERMRTGLPEQASGLVAGFIDQVVNQRAPGPLSIGLLLALWAGSTAFMALAKSLERAYEVRVPRPWIKQRVLSLGVMVVCAVLFLSGSVLLLAGPALAGAVDFWGVAGAAWSVAQWPLALLLVVGAFWISYYVLPAQAESREGLNCLIGALLAAALWVGATALFRLYIANFASYSQSYGILGTIIVLLLWLYLAAMVILLGGELASELHFPPEAGRHR
ncbi:MAG: YihY/virulence factor BrkB family protein [Longimicrobiaceae bacterium]